MDIVHFQRAMDLGVYTCDECNDKIKLYVKVLECARYSMKFKADPVKHDIGLMLGQCRRRWVQR